MLNANDFKKKQIIFLFTNEGDKLSFLNDNIIVKNKEGEIKYQSTCYRLCMICVVGNISITSGLISVFKIIYPHGVGGLPMRMAMFRQMLLIAGLRLRILGMPVLH